jgi:hypothetical protein
LWEPHVVAGEWSLDLDWFVAAAKEMVRLPHDHEVVAGGPISLRVVFFVFFFF